MPRISLQIPDRVLQVIGGAYLFGLAAAFVGGIISEIRKGSSEDEGDLSLATTHPGVPTNLFSATLKRKDNPAFEKERANLWLLMYGDKISHSILSLLVHISQGARLTGADSQGRTNLFALFLQGALTESRLELSDKKVSARSGDAMLECLAVTLLDTPLAQLDLYNRMLCQSEDERSESLVGEAASSVNAAPRVTKAFRAAFLLLRGMVRILICQMPR